MKPIAQSEANTLLKEILSYLDSNEPISEFSVKLLLKKAEKQPTNEQMHSLTAMIYALYGNNRELAREHALATLRYVSQPASISHVVFVLRGLGLNKDLIQMSDDFKTYLNNVEYALNLAPIYTAFPDIEKISHIYNLCQKANISDDNFELKSKFEQALKIVNSASEFFRFDPSVVTEVSRVVAEVSDSYSVVVERSIVETSPSGDGLCLSFYLAPHNADLFDLNWDLAEKIIEKDLNKFPVVAKFENL